MNQRDRVVDRIAQAPEANARIGELGPFKVEWRQAPDHFKSVVNHKIRRVFYESWMYQGKVVAKHTYGECNCGDRYVIKQSGPLVKDYNGWDASEEMVDAQRHFGHIFWGRLAHRRDPERDQIHHLRVRSPGAEGRDLRTRDPRRLAPRDRRASVRDPRPEAAPRAEQP